MGIWKEDFMVADIEEPENLDASDVLARRLNAKEVLMLENGGNFIFPIADGTVKLSGGDQVFRKSTSIQVCPARGEEHNDGLQGESDGSQLLDTLTDDSVARNDCWSIEGSYIQRHHVEPEVELYVPKEESFPIPLRCIDVIRRTNTTLGVLQESRMDDYWNIDGDRNLSEP